MKQYLDLLRHVLAEGVHKSDRTGTGTRSVFGYQMRFDLQGGFPLLTTKKVFPRGVFGELLWFLQGRTNIAYLKEHGVSIWDDWADEHGELGPVYGKQWRRWETVVPGKEGAPPTVRTIDQITQLVEGLKNNPDSRRHLVCAWNPGEVDRMALPPCHALFQFYVAPPAPGDADPRPRLSCQLYQRSADIFLGVPFNIASYALLTMMIAQVCGYRPGEFIHTLGDAHLYSNHLEQAKLQLSREPRNLPVMRINPEVKDLFAFRFEDFSLEGYDPHPHIAAPVAV